MGVCTLPKRVLFKVVVIMNRVVTILPLVALASAQQLSWMCRPYAFMKVMESCVGKSAVDEHKMMMMTTVRDTCLSQPSMSMDEMMEHMMPEPEPEPHGDMHHGDHDKHGDHGDHERRKRSGHGGHGKHGDMKHGEHGAHGDHGAMEHPGHPTEPG